MVDCRQYVENYVSAHTDGELSAEELRSVAEHLEDCLGDCHDRFAAERLLKAWLQKRVAPVPTPDELRGKILASLDRYSEFRSLGGAILRALRRMLDRARPGSL